jgi:hypothetical protein
MGIINLLRRMRKAPASSTPPRARYFHAVAIMPRMSSCKQAREKSGVRFLSREAPPLPLPGCPWPEKCPCRFEKFPDRRQEERRDIASSGRWYPGNDRRRMPRGRRATDR